MSENLHKIHLTSFQVIILGFAGVILSGALLLMLPWASVKGAVTPFHEALFTATSAVCVTGLVVQYRIPEVTGLPLDRQLFFF